jgi:hypothetical protein
MSLDIDINSDLLSLEINDRFTFALASTLALDGSADSGTPHPSRRHAAAAWRRRQPVGGWAGG